MTMTQWRDYYVRMIDRYRFRHNLTHSEAAMRAYNHCLVAWLDRNPGRMLHSHCAVCAQDGYSGNILVPYGTKAGGYMWLHTECWPAWYRQRSNDAEAALQQCGITAGGLK